MRAQRRRFADGRLHLQDGPIDLIIEAFGETSAVEDAYAAAWGRFATILDELCTELPLLRADPLGAQAPRGAVARRMAAAVAPFRARRFLTPMAAVAGAVAEEVLEAMTTGRKLARAYVNNGGDIALHLSARRDVLDRHGRSPGPAESVRPRDDRRCGRRARRRDVGLARTQLLAWRR